MVWPEDHPGKICAKCGRKVYWLWVDAVYPPPGTCMFDAPEARHCSDFRNFCIGQMQMSRMLDKAPHPEFLKQLERAGVTLDEAIKWRDDYQAREDAKSRSFLEKRGAELPERHSPPRQQGESVKP